MALVEATLGVGVRSFVGAIDETARMTVLTWVLKDHGSP